MPDIQVQFEKIQRMIGRVASDRDIDRVMPWMIKEMVDLMDADRGMLLVNRGARRLETATACIKGQPDFTEKDLNMSRKILDEVARKKKPLLIVDAGTDPRFKASESIRALELKSCICHPMIVNNKFLGAIYLDSLGSSRVFSRKDINFLGVVADVAGIALDSARAHTRLMETARISDGFLTTLDLDVVFEKVLAGVVKLTSAQQGFLMLEENGNLAVKDAVARSGRKPEKDEQHLSMSVVRQVFESGQGLITSNVQGHSELAAADSVIGLNLTSLLCVPVRTERAVLGALYLENSIHEGIFDNDDLMLVQLLANRAGVAIENARLHGKERQIVKALANAVEVRDSGTSQHVHRVAHYAVAVGKKMGLSGHKLLDLEQSAILHDIGKIGIPDRVLLKPGRLNDEERGVIMTHADLGRRIVMPIGLPKSVEDGIWSHQERFDGSGYPRGLRGGKIPLFGRIIAVVDSYDAMTSDRPYHRGMKKADAIEEIRRNAGIHFCPEAAKAFLTVLEEESGS